MRSYIYIIAALVSVAAAAAVDASAAADAAALAEHNHQVEAEQVAAARVFFEALRPSPDPALSLLARQTWSTCFWSGTSPFCAGSCPEGYHQVQVDGCGDGACCFTGYKTKCCK
ncbi:hypothetical protein N657DRAFT_401843 [Parathielavia appendiculata]|uniref:Uncharacterized protein n=1 Tax=Parathielavia appendiculata TaxID=2587402 RepID=A0AAN6U1R6_9PEZI|nr:hypothetical protein N657DRAFT_401843 [Parathielavia appendiculata]